MADSKLSELTSTTTVGETDLFYIVQSNASKRITGGNLIASLTQISSAPANAKGVVGDVVGMIAFDSTYFYVCTATYSNGTANIWKRASITEW